MRKFFALLFCATSCAVQLSAQINSEAAPFTRAQYFDNNGAPCLGCQIWTYSAGTTTPLDSYTTTAANVANHNPVQLDGAGRADIFLGPSAYKLVLELPPAPGSAHGTVLWTEDNISPLGLLAYQNAGTAVSACAATYAPPYTGVTGINLCTFLSSWIDVRTFGAVGVQGNCHSSGVNNQPAIQAALNYAYTNGPMDVLLPNNYCWPILTHLWVPPGVHFHGIGRTQGYEVSSSGSLLIANTGWAAANTAFPFSQMVWETGDNFSSGPYLASNVTFAAEVDHMEVNCNDQVGCGNLLGIGRQEKSSFHDLVLTGSVPFSGGYSYGFYEQGVDCNGSTPNASGCLIAKSTSPSVSNPFSGQQGPDYHLEFFPSYNAPSANFIPFAEMGANNYKGLRDSTLNCNGDGSAIGGYFWGEETTMGPGIHMEGCGSNNQFSIGNIPAGTGCNGATNSLFVTSDPQFVIQGCAAQNHLSFVNVSGGIVNNQTGAPDVNISSTDYYFDNSGGVVNAGPLGVQYGWRGQTPIISTDPGYYFQVGYNPFSAFLGTPFSGWNSGNSNEAAAAMTRAYSCGNTYYAHSIGQWSLGGDGGTDYSCILHLNGGSLGLSAYTTNTNPISTASMLGNVRALLSGGGNASGGETGGHFLVGPNWISTSTGLTTGEQNASLQIHGGISGDVQMGNSTASTCPTGASAGSTCTFTVTWSSAYANTTYPVVCSLLEPTGAPSIQGVSRSTGSVTVKVQNGQGSQAIASGATGAACWAIPNTAP